MENFNLPNLIYCNRHKSKGDIYVTILRNKKNDSYSFVNLTKGYIYPFEFSTIGEAMEHLNNCVNNGDINYYEFSIPLVEKNDKLENLINEIKNYIIENGDKSKYITLEVNNKSYHSIIDYFLNKENQNKHGMSLIVEQHGFKVIPRNLNDIFFRVFIDNKSFLLKIEFDNSLVDFDYRLFAFSY